MPILKFQPAPLAGLRPGSQSAREKVFLEHYAWLLECALNMTRGQRERAEDLVHDVFVQFHVKQVDLATIDDVRGYLNGMLRNLHLLQLRRSTRHPLHQLSLLDHDTVAISLRAQDSADQLQSLDLLRRACEFVCYRKETALTASVLILRFFHGYYPEEICRLLSSKRKAVDQWIVRGRNDAKEYLSKPYPLPESVTTIETILPTATTAGSFLRSLREFIFASCTTPCSLLTTKERDFDTADLAHFVSCAVCLTRRCEELGLPGIGERMADEISDRDDSKSGGGGGATSKGLVLRASRKTSRANVLRRGYERRREIFEHHPKELSLTFDGQAHATLLLNAAVNTLNLSLDRNELPSCVAILSDQDFRFLLLDAADLASSETKRYSLMLSDGRSLEVLIEPETLGPSIQVVYRDPVFGQAMSLKDEAEFDHSKTSIMKFFEADDSVKPKSIIRSAVRGIARLAKGFKRLFVDMMSPMLATALVCGVAAIVLFTLSLRGHSVMKADELLQRATVAENAAVRSGATGVVVQSVRIQTTQRKTERTLYRDVQQKRRLKDKTLSQQDALLRAQLENFGIAWNDPLSAGSFRDWHDRVAVARDVVKRPENGLLTLTTTVSAGRIASESLTVREADFHPVKRTVELRDEGTVEVAELNYSVLPWSTVNPDIFEPLTPISEAKGQPLHASVLPHPPRGVTPGEMDLAELSARLVLNRLGFDANSRIEISRGADGVHVQGIVDTETQKTQLQMQLRLVPHVLPSILTVQEMAANYASGPEITSIHQSSEAAEAPSSLERYFTEHGLDRKGLPPTAEEFVESSFAVKHETGQISTLLQRFSTNTTLPTEARTALGELLVQHKTALLAALGREERALMAVQLIDHPSSASASGADGAQGLRDDAEKNFALCVELTSGSESEPRYAQVIAPQLANSIAELRVAALQISMTALFHSPSPGSAGLASKND
jgi:DNA-directed RNA polymerase specialized sigma24 family protein